MSVIGNILITGTSRGLGLGLVKQFCAEKKNRVFAACRWPENAEELNSLAAANENVRVIKLDPTKDDQITAAVQMVKSEAGTLQLLINNSGMMNRNPIDELTREEILNGFDVNVASIMIMTKEFLPILKASTAANAGEYSKYAGIANISSNMGSIDDSSGGVPVYRCTKTAVNMFTHSSSFDLVKRDVLSIAIHPGWVQTDMGNSGGRKAPLTIEESTSGMAQQCRRLCPDLNGAFIDWKGDKRAW